MTYTGVDEQYKNSHKLAQAAFRQGYQHEWRGVIRINYQESCVHWKDSFAGIPISLPTLSVCVPVQSTFC